MGDMKEKLRAKLAQERATQDEAVGARAGWGRVITQRLEDQDIVAAIDVPEEAPDYTVIPPPAPMEPPTRG